MADTKQIIGDILGGMGPGLLSGIGKALTDKGKPQHFEQQDQPQDSTKAPSYKDGTDYVPKTGKANLHKGEAVLKKEDADTYREGKMSKPHNVSLYRAMHHLNKGGLHRALNVPEGTPIPKEKLAAAKKSTSEHVRHMANFASTMEGFKH